MIVFLPILTHWKASKGKLFKPMALTMIFALVEFADYVAHTDAGSCWPVPPRQGQEESWLCASPVASTARLRPRAALPRPCPPGRAGPPGARRPPRLHMGGGSSNWARGELSPPRLRVAGISGGRYGGGGVTTHRAAAGRVPDRIASVWCLGGASNRHQTRYGRQLADFLALKPAPKKAVAERPHPGELAEAMGKLFRASRARRLHQ